MKYQCLHFKTFQHSCIPATVAKDFGHNSFLEWDFKDDFYRTTVDSQRHFSELQLMFRTRQPSGLLLLAQNAHKSEYLKLEVRCAPGVHCR